MPGIISDLVQEPGLKVNILNKLSGNLTVC